jgi:hypothetical protein
MATEVQILTNINENMIIAVYLDEEYNTKL